MGAVGLRSQKAMESPSDLLKVCQAGRAAGKAFFLLPARPTHTMHYSLIFKHTGNPAFSRPSIHSTSPKLSIAMYSGIRPYLRFEITIFVSPPH